MEMVGKPTGKRFSDREKSVFLLDLRVLSTIGLHRILTENPWLDKSEAVEESGGILQGSCIA